MKRNYYIFRGILITAMVFIGIFMCLLRASDAAENRDIDIARTFDTYEGVMLVMDPDSYKIIYANDAAAEYYGYSKEQLINMTMPQINVLTPDQMAAERLEAQRDERDYIKVQQRMADGTLRWVEIHAFPVEYGGKEVMFSIIHDITRSVRLEEDHQRLMLVSAVTGMAVFFVLVILSITLGRKTRSLSKANKELENFNELSQTFIDADSGMVYLKDEELRYIFFNEAFKDFVGLSHDDIIGRTDSELVETDLEQICAASEQNALERQKLVTGITSWNDKFYRTTKFPVRMLNGTFGVGAYVRDVTEEFMHRRHRERMSMHNELMLEMLTRNFSGKQEQLDYVLHRLLKLTESEYGYIYFYNEGKEEFVLNTWTQGVMQECTVEGKQRIYQLANTGIWGEVVRQRRSIIVNDFEKPNPLKKGYPKGHVALKRFMSVPVFVDGKIVAVVGLGNKKSDYDQNDVDEMTILMSGVWNAVERREASETLFYERNKYYQTLVSIGDGVMVIDKDGNVEFLNYVASRLTGWGQDEAVGVCYKRVLNLSHEQKGHTIEDPIEKALITGKVQELDGNAILTSKTGTRYNLEESAAPIFDDKGILAGVVLVFRDVTLRNERLKKIEYMSFHDALTGLYNRGHFEEELRRLDTAENLPISVLIGDVNNLKLTNDVLGHTFGDMLLKKVADSMRRVCRKGDITARWGGDEFVVLLPGTDAGQAADIAGRIRNEVSSEKILDIGCSISIGHDTKLRPGEDITQVLVNAETNMYSSKVLERHDVQSFTLKSIVDSFYENNEQEREHAVRVSKMCRKLGAALGLTESDIQKLSKAGYLHDIGKVVLEPDLLSKGYRQQPRERKKIEQHPLVGYRILNYFDETLELAEPVLTHHEYWDGSGYPKGLKGEEIPLFARIIAIAEVYDRMLHGPYFSERKSRDEAVSEMRRLAGIQFDPDLTDTFIELMKADLDVDPDSWN